MGRVSGGSRNPTPPPKTLPGRKSEAVGDLAVIPGRASIHLPAIISHAGEKASEHFLEFFAATIRNKKTRAAYVQAVAQFCRWCERHSLLLLASGRYIWRPTLKDWGSARLR